MACESGMLKFSQISFCFLLMLLVACSQNTSNTSESRKEAILELQSREVLFPNYPQSGKTYLYFDLAHGFQANFLSNGDAWLWYPGNVVIIQEVYRQESASGQPVLCWKHSSNTSNPVTGRRGGIACEPLESARKSVVAVLNGDPFNLRTGIAPYKLPRCKSPDRFKFDRKRFRC